MKNNKTVLVCDDNDGILELVTLVLEDAGFRTLAVRNSLNLYNTIEAERPDLLLLDLWMPVLSGDQVLKHLRQNPGTASLPVIVISASRDGKSIAERSGANGFIAKPFDIDELVAKVESCFNSYKPVTAAR